MLISHRGHTDTIQVYSVTVMTHVKAFQAGHSSQGTSDITPARLENYTGQPGRVVTAMFVKEEYSIMYGSNITQKSITIHIF